MKGLPTDSGNKAKVLPNGAVLLGKLLVCDGFSWNRPIGAVTHIHQDHIQDFESALGFCDPILMSAATKDLLVALKGDHLLMRRNLRSVPFGIPFSYEDESITLHPTEHVLGSSQVLLEDGEDRIVYTGDFNYPTEVVEADILVVDATYGDPINIRTFDREVPISRLLSIVKRELAMEEPVFIFSYHCKIQRLMNTFRKADIDVPFVVRTDDFKIARVYEKYGFLTGDCICRDSSEASEMIGRSDPCIAFHTVGTIVPEAEKHLSIRVGSYEAIEPVYRYSRNRYVVAISDHADFNGIMEYVRRSKPKLVVTDSSRGGGAFMLAEEIKRRLNVDARPCPS